MAVRLSALHAGRPLPPRKFPGTHFCWRLSRPQDHNAAGRIRSVEKIHLIGDRTRDLLACNIVPEPVRCQKFFLEVSIWVYIEVLPRFRPIQRSTWNNVRHGEVYPEHLVFSLAWEYDLCRLSTEFDFWFGIGFSEVYKCVYEWGHGIPDFDCFMRWCLFFRVTRNIRIVPTTTQVRGGLSNWTGCVLILHRRMSLFWEAVVSVILGKIVYVHVSYSERFPKQSYFTVQFQNCW
jgi:hypothetical protein